MFENFTVRISALFDLEMFFIYTVTMIEIKISDNLNSFVSSKVSRHKSPKFHEPRRKMASPNEW